MKIDKWIKSAEVVLEAVGIVQDGQYPKAYKGYISSLSASIIQSGLMPALVFYEEKGADADNNRTLVVEAILGILREEKIIPADYQGGLSDYVITCGDKKELLRCINQALISLKLSIRMYASSDEVYRQESGYPKGQKVGSEAGEGGTGVAGRVEEAPLREEVTDLYKYEWKVNKYANVGWLYYREFYRDFMKKKVTILYRESKEKSLDNNFRWVKQQMKKREYKKEGQIEWTADRQELLFLKKSRVICNSRLGNFSRANERIINLLKNMDRQACFVQDRQGASRRLYSYEFFTLKTLYPGLLIGSGLSHGTACKNDSKIGFQFDFTTGLPIIPGSSVKGVLRSMFPDPDRAEDDEYNVERCGYIRSVLAEKCGFGGVSDKELLELAERIFRESDAEARADCGGRDVFMDALLTGSDNECWDGGRLFMGDDFITPHKKPLKDPIPIQFLKVLPDVSFTFVFRLASTRLGKPDKQSGMQRILGATSKGKLFKQIVLDVGVGAKTNVGYGHFQEVKVD